jgi:hypothetical protein
LVNFWVLEGGIEPVLRTGTGKGYRLLKPILSIMVLGIAVRLSIDYCQSNNGGIFQIKTGTSQKSPLIKGGKGEQRSPNQFNFAQKVPDILSPHQSPYTPDE